MNNYHYAEWDTRKPPLPLEEVMHVFEALPPGIEVRTWPRLKRVS